MTNNLLTKPAHLVLHAVTHPVSTVAYGVGLARGAAGAVLRAASRAGGPAHAEWVAPPEPVAEEAVGPDRVELADLPPAAPQQAPGVPGEQFATEPTAVSRASAHGGGGHDQEIDDWYGEADSAEPAEGVLASLEAGDDLPGEPADLKAVLSEAETLRRAADRDA